MYGVFDNGKPASSKGFPVLKGKGWQNHTFDTFEQAVAYARHWLGERADCVALTNPDTRYDYSGYGDTIEIRTMTPGEIAADKLSHDALVEAAHAWSELGTDDEH